MATYHDKYFGISPRITRWKEPSDFEKELADSAESNLESRRLYTEYYKHLNPEYYNSGYQIAFDMYKARAKDMQETNFDDVYTDMVYCLHRYGLSFQDYFIYDLINKAERERKTFVSDKLRYHYCDLLNGVNVPHMMTDKWECFNNYSKFFKREVVGCTENENLDEFIRFVKRHDKFIYKPKTEHSGHGIKLIHTSEIDPQKWFIETVKSQPGIVEELIEQGDELNIINPSSINSCRITSFTLGKEVKIIGATLRMGVGDAITDNAGAGGIYSSIDPERGILQSDARNYLNQHYKFHPTTRTPILGFALPEWDKAIDLINEVALHKLGTTLISWDISYSKNGWCMVEANENGDWSILQSNLQQGKKDELYSLMDRYFEQKSSNGI